MNHLRYIGAVGKEKSEMPYHTVTITASRGVKGVPPLHYVSYYVCMY